MNKKLKAEILGLFHRMVKDLGINATRKLLTPSQDNETSNFLIDEFENFIKNDLKGYIKNEYKSNMENSPHIFKHSISSRYNVDLAFSDALNKPIITLSEQNTSKDQVLYKKKAHHDNGQTQSNDDSSKLRTKLDSIIKLLLLTISQKSQSSYTISLSTVMGLYKSLYYRETLEGRDFDITSEDCVDCYIDSKAGFEINEAFAILNELSDSTFDQLQYYSAAFSVASFLTLHSFCYSGSSTLNIDLDAFILQDSYYLQNTILFDEARRVRQEVTHDRFKQAGHVKHVIKALLPYIDSSQDTTSFAQKMVEKIVERLGYLQHMTEEQTIDYLKKRKANGLLEYQLPGLLMLRDYDDSEIEKVTQLFSLCNEEKES